MKRTLKDIFGDASKEEQILMINEFRTNFRSFTEKVLGFKLGKFHDKVIKTVLENRYSVIIIPRGHLKTTLFAIAYPLWNLWVKNSGFEICLISSAIDQSIKTFRKVRDIMEDNEFLNQYLPLSKKQSWEKTSIETANGNYYYIKPFNSTTKGTHVDLMICDDLLRQENLNQEQVKEIFWSIVFPTVQTRRGKLIVIGTPQSPDDLLSELEKNWGNIRLPAVITKKDKWIKPLWNERFSLKELKDIQQSMGTYRFNREYMCSPESMLGSAVYPPEIVLDCTNDNLGFAGYKKGKIYIGADFAMSGSKYGDYSVFTVVDTYYDETREFKNDNPIVIRKIIRLKGASFELQKKYLLDLYHDYGASAVVIDISGVGQAFYDDLILEHINVIDKKFDSRSRNSYLINLRKLLENKRVVIPMNQNDMNAYALGKELIKELTAMEEKETHSGTRTIQSTAKHDDMVMSLALAVSEIGSQRPIQALLAF